MGSPNDRAMPTPEQAIAEKSKELASRFVARSLQDSRHILQRLIDADSRVGNDDIESLRYLSHRISGTGATLGFDKVSESALALELCLAQQRHAVSAEEIERLRDLSQQLLADLHDLAADHGSPSAQHIAPLREAVKFAAPTTVVVVDDDPEIREIAAAALGVRDDWAIHTCDSGYELLDRIERIRPDFVLLDAMMPGMDGPTTLTRLRVLPAFSDTPVAFITANAMPREVSRYASMGVAGVITKPFDPMMLAQQVIALWQPAAQSLPADEKTAVRRPSPQETSKTGIVEVSEHAARSSRLEWLLQGVLEVQSLVTDAEFDLHTFMQRVVDVTEKLTQAKGAVVELVDGEEMVYRAASTSIRQHVGLRLKRAHSLSGLSVEQGQVLSCDDTEHDPRVDQAACRKVGVRSMLCTPLFEAGRAVGVLKVMSDRPRAFGSDDQYLLTLLAGALGAALGRQLALQELKRSEELFRTAMETAPIGHALVLPNGRFLRVNTALCELLGYAEAELLDNDWRSLTHPQDVEHHWRLVQQALAGETARYRVETRYYHQSGRVIWTLLSAALVRDSAGEPRYFVAQIQDVTEQREMEHLKTEFISMVSHELRTPLTSIRGALGLVLGRHGAALPAPVRRFLDIANGNCERLNQLINDILDIDKVASGQMRFDIAETGVADVLVKSVQATEPYAQRYKVRFALEMPAGSLRIAVDESRLVQVLVNLLSNAAKFSPRGEAVHISSAVCADRVRISVADRGPGIPEEFRERIFGKFAQADSSATRRVGGTGLGLHISQQIVQRMGGAIGFDSQVGRGATFWVEFRRVASAEGHAPQLYVEPGCP